MVESELIFAGRPGNIVKMGIVGMPNIGKSLLFNLLSGHSVPSENYPFCTIEPSVAKVVVCDKRFDYLCDSFNPKSRVSAALTITDIAGLVKGASTGKGLGNEFLSHIYGVDGIFHVVRAFPSKTVEHVEGNIDPVRDLEIITNELRLKDASIVEKKINSMERVAASTNDSTVKDEFECYKKLLKILKNCDSLLSTKWTNNEIDLINALYLLTAKPVVFLVNVSAVSWQNKKNKWVNGIKEWVKKTHPNSPLIMFSAAFEQKLNDLGEQKAKDYINKLNVPNSRINKIIRSGYTALSLCHFFTCGEKEVKCWTVRKNTNAKKAAAVIHSDFEKYFICAMIMSFENYKKYGSEAEVKKNGKYLTAGKKYVVQDGDIILFRHGAGSKNKKK